MSHAESAECRPWHGRVIARARITGREHLNSLQGPVIFAPNHQSHLDTPLILSALPSRYRYRVGPAMWREYFDGHFCPSRHTLYERFRDSVLYWLVALFFNAFPIPQTEADASVAALSRRVGERQLVYIVLSRRRANGGRRD